jgi:twinkle protein
MKKIDLTDKELMNFIGQQESQEVGDFSSYSERVANHLRSGARLIGDKLPWAKTHDYVRCGEGQLSIWAGINGHGKSELVTNVMTHFMLNGRKVLIASMEMKPEEILTSVCSQAAGCEPSVKFSQGLLNDLSETGFIYECEGRVKKERMLGLVHYAGSELKIDHMVIDSLTMCVNRDDYEGQAEFCNNLRAAAKQWNMHIHLVVHMRKGESESKMPNKYDIRGAGEISDLTDKLFIVFRNKQREKNQEKFGDQPGVWLALEKNRQDGDEANFGLYFHKQSKQFTAFENKTMNLFRGNKV